MAILLYTIYRDINQVTRFILLNVIFIFSAHAQPEFLTIYNGHEHPIELATIKLKSTLIAFKYTQLAGSQPSKEDPLFRHVTPERLFVKKLKFKEQEAYGGVLFPMITTPYASFILLLNINKKRPGLLILSAAEKDKELAFLSDKRTEWSLYVSEDGKTIKAGEDPNQL